MQNYEFIDRYNCMIQATMFNETVSKWSKTLIEGQIYTIERAQVEISNPKYISVKNEYCLTIDEGSRIVHI